MRASGRSFGERRKRQKRKQKEERTRPTFQFPDMPNHVQTPRCHGLARKFFLQLGAENRERYLLRRNFRVVGKSLVGNARKATRAGELPGSANLRPIPSAKLGKWTPQAMVLQHPARGQATRGARLRALYQSAVSAGPAEVQSPAPPFDHFSLTTSRPERGLQLEAQAVCQTASECCGILIGYKV